MESWRKVWREAVAPLLSDQALGALEQSLARDDPRLIQGATCQPPPLQVFQNCGVEGACLLSYCGWQGEGLESVGEVEEFFARMCFEIDQRLGEPAGCRWLLQWYDETPRDKMIQNLLPEVRMELEKRKEKS